MSLTFYKCIHQGSLKILAWKAFHNEESLALMGFNTHLHIKSKKWQPQNLLYLVGWHIHRHHFLSPVGCLSIISRSTTRKDALFITTSLPKEETYFFRTNYTNVKYGQGMQEAHDDVQVREEIIVHPWQNHEDPTDCHHKEHLYESLETEKQQ